MFPKTGKWKWDGGKGEEKKGWFPDSTRPQSRQKFATNTRLAKKTPKNVTHGDREKKGKITRKAEKRIL